MYDDDGTRIYIMMYANDGTQNIYDDAIHKLDKLNSFPAIYSFKLFSSMARAVGL